MAKSSYTLKEFYGEIGCSAFTYFVSGVLLLNAGNIRVLERATDWGSAFMPRLIAVFLIVCATFLLSQALLRFYRHKDALTAERRMEKKGNNFKLSRLLDDYPEYLSMTALCIYVFTMQRLGYILSTMIYIVLQAYILSVKGIRKNWLIAVVAVIAPLAIFLLFSRVFGMVLPRGIFAI